MEIIWKLNTRDCYMGVTDPRRLLLISLSSYYSFENQGISLNENE
jgi:hypothetical protein